MFNQDNDMQKRTMIFFVIVAVLLIGYTAINQYLHPPKQTETQNQTQKVENKNIEKQNNIENAQKIDKEKQKITYVSSGSYDLILNNTRFKADDLKNVVEIKTGYGTVKISKIGGRVVSIFLNKYNTDVIGKVAKENKIFPTEIITTNPKITALINFSEYKLKKEGNRYIFELNKEGINIKKEFILNPDETISYKLSYKGLENLGIAVINGITPDPESSTFGHLGALIKTDKELIKIDSDIKTTQVIRGNIIWAGEENKYFLQMVANKTGFSTVYVIPVATDTTATLSEIKGDLNGFFFGGPKLYSLLGQINEKYKKQWNNDLSLRETISFGIFGILGKPLFLILHFIYNFVHNWALSIIIITVLLRIVLFPLNHKSLKAMKKMADLAPEIKKIQKKYKDDPQKLQAEMMKLYSEHGANPMSGCLPIVAQIPIFIALYNVLMVSVELKNVPFLWIPDLSQMDPYYVLPILMGLSMVAQQWITPSSDKNQKMIMYVMAAVFTFLFMSFPAGLVLYWLTNNILGIGQSFLINKTMHKEGKKA